MMRRVLVIGSGGAGKTTLARRIAARTGLPPIHLDALFWKPGWVPTPEPGWDAVVAELVTRDAWVMDGNYGRTLPQRLAAADTVIFLDYPRLRCIWRALRRSIRHHGREALGDGVRVVVLRDDGAATNFVASLTPAS